MNKRPAMAWSLSARPHKADEGTVFLDLSTDTMYAFEDGKWHELEDMSKSKARKAQKAKEETQTQTTEVISNEEKPAETPAPAPKKTTTKKKTASKKAAE